MSFDVAADAYDRSMGRYSMLLSPQLADGPLISIARAFLIIERMRRS